MANLFTQRFSLVSVLAFLLFVPIVWWGAIRSSSTNNNNIRQWLPEDYQETQTYDWFRKHFGSDEFAIVSWKGCTLEDERLNLLAKELLHDHFRQDGQPQWFEQVRTGPELLQTLTDPPFRLDRDKAINRLRGFIIATDRETTCALVTLSAAGDEDRVAAVNRLRQIAVQRVGIDADELRMAGDPVFNAEIDIASEQAIGNLPAWSAIIALTVAMISLHSFRLTAVVFIAAAYTGASALAMVWFTGGNLNLVLVVMPVLIYVLTLSAAVHLANYYRDSVTETGIDTAPGQSLARGALPCTLAAVTTAIGVGSLQVSHVIPISDFGFYSAIGILISLLVLFLLFPSLLKVTSIKVTSLRAIADQQHTSQIAARFKDWLDPLLERMAGVIVRRQIWISLVCLICLLYFAGGVAFIKTSVKPARFFPEDSRILQDIGWFRDSFGSIVPIEVVVKIDDNKSSLDMLERMELVRDIHIELLKAGETSATMSAVTFAPTLRAPKGVKRAGVLGAIGRIAGAEPNRTWRNVLNTKLKENRNEFIDHGYIGEDGNLELWRLSMRAEMGESEDYEATLDSLSSRVDKFLNDQEPDRVAGVSIAYTGMVPLFFLAQRELLDGLFKSFLTAFALIAVLMVMVLRSLGGGIVAMLPNLFPAAVVFGYMGYSGVVIDIGAMLTASAAMGIAVDDTVHYLTWFRRGLDQGMQRHSAIVYAYQRCATAMMQTTAIAGLGLVVYATSTFQPVSQFGWLMFVLLLITLVGDLVFLPSLLAGLGGKVFQRNVKSPKLTTSNLGELSSHPPKAIVETRRST